MKHFEEARIAKGGDIGFEKVARRGEVGAVDAVWVMGGGRGSGGGVDGWVGGVGGEGVVVGGGGGSADQVKYTDGVNTGKVSVKG